MPKRIYRQPEQSTQEQIAEAKATTEADIDAAQRTDEQQARIDASDELLDEIDGVLETNAQAFVNAYVQQGGQ